MDEQKRIDWLEAQMEKTQSKIDYWIEKYGAYAEELQKIKCHQHARAPQTI